MNINAFGTDNFLRYTIRNRMRQIKEDDMVRPPLFSLATHLTLCVSQAIEAEGLSALSLPELQAACQSRGIRTLNVAEDHLRSELAQWVELHVNRGLSGTLLILSKAFAFNRGAGQGAEAEGDEIMRSLKDTLASLPDNLVREAFSSSYFILVVGLLSGKARLLMTLPCAFLRVCRSTKPSWRSRPIPLRTSNDSKCFSNRRS